MKELSPEWIHLLVIVIGGALSVYVSYRQLKLKDEIKTDIVKAIKEHCASKDSFDAHEKQDTERFESIQQAATARHGEIRQDVAAESRRVDDLFRRPIT